MQNSGQWAILTWVFSPEASCIVYRTEVRGVGKAGELGTKVIKKKNLCLIVSFLKQGGLWAAGRKILI